MSRKKEKTNKSKELVKIDPLESVEVIMNSKKYAKKDKQRLKFHLLRFFNVPVQTCAKITGYSEKYAYKIDKDVRDLAKLPPTLQRFFDDMPGRYKALAKARLPQIASIEGKVLDEYDADPKLAIDKPQMLKQIKQSGGVLEEEGSTKIDYKAIAIDARTMMIELGESIDNPDSATEAEIIKGDE